MSQVERGESEAIEPSWALLAAANACAPGLAAWAWTREDRKALLLDNQVVGDSSWDALAWAAVSAVVVALVYLLVWRRSPARGPALRRLTVLLSPLAATIGVPLMYVPEIEGARWLLVVLLIFALAGTLGASVAAAWPWLRERESLGRLGASRIAPASVLAVATLGWTAMIIRLAIVRHQSLGSRIWDLGIFDNLLFHAAMGDWQTTTVLRGETFTSAHCAPILQLLAPLYMLAPGPEVLIVMQSVWLASAVIPVYLLVDRVFERWPARRWLGVAFGLSWLGHPSLHGVALFDFHALTLAAPMILWAMAALERRRFGLWAAMVLALLATREDLPFVVVALGLYALASGHRRVAGLTIAAALLGLAIVKLALMQHPDLIMPDGESSYRYASRFGAVIRDAEHGGGLDILSTLLTNPAFVIQHALTPGKLIFWATMAAPSLFLFVAGGRGLWVLSFGLLFVALGSGANLHNLYLHYTVFSFPAMLGVAVLGLARIVERVDESRRGAALAAVAVALVCTAGLAGERFGALARSDAFLAGNAPLLRELDDHQRERYAWLRAAVEQIPAEASVAASISVGPHVSTRADFHHFRDRQDAEWIVVRLDELSKPERKLLFDGLRRGELERVDQYGNELAIYRRR